MEIKIDKGIPIPETRGAYGWPLSKMAVGDSFFYQAASPKKRRNAQCAVHEAAKCLGIKGRTRREQVDGIDGFRCWRYA